MSVTDPLRVARAVVTLRGFRYVPGRPLDDRQAEALAVLYRRYAPELLAVARRILRTETDAEDAVHDVFTRLPGILHQHRGGHLGAWLARVAERTALMQLRRTRRRHDYLLAVGTRRRDFELEGWSTSEVGEAIHDALAELAEPLREVVVLRMYLDYTHGEIADVLDITRTASEVKLSRGLKRLRETMRGSRAPQLRRSA